MDTLENRTPSGRSLSARRRLDPPKGRRD
jgi:hypothetical protein